MTQTNPLMQHYVQPATYVTLPSRGKYYPTTPILNADGEIQVHAMTAIDELQFQSPDGLLNNDSLVEVLARTVPNIPNSKEILKPDLDVLLIGLRIATYGPNMDVETRCDDSKCGHSDIFTVNLMSILSTAQFISDDDTLEVGGVKVQVVPYNILSQTRMNEHQIEIQRTARILDTHLQNVENENFDEKAIEVLRTRMDASIKKTTQEMFSIVGDSVIKTTILAQTEESEDIVVTNREHIMEWVQSFGSHGFQKNSKSCC